MRMIPEPEKEALEYLKPVLKVCPNRGHFFSEQITECLDGDNENSSIFTARRLDI